MQTITSSFLSLNWRNAIHGLIMAIGGAVYAVISESISKGNFTIDFTGIWHTALAATVIYLGKKFFTPSQAIKPVQ